MISVCCGGSCEGQPAARSLNYDWGTQLDGNQVQRWAEALGSRVVREREAETRSYQGGVRPAAPANQPALLVVGLDGGRVQERDKDPDNELLVFERGPNWFRERIDERRRQRLIEPSLRVPKE